MPYRIPDPLNSRIKPNAQVKIRQMLDQLLGQINLSNLSPQKKIDYGFRIIQLYADALRGGMELDRYDVRHALKKAFASIDAREQKICDALARIQTLARIWGLALDPRDYFPPACS